MPARNAAFLALALAVAGCAAPCRTADLDARYAASIAVACLGPDGRPMPLESCPAHDDLAAQYERDVAKRLESDECTR